MARERITHTQKLTIPKDSNLNKEREELLKNLENISPEETEKIGTDIYLRLVKNDLNRGVYDNLNKDAALILINSGNIDLFFDNIDKFKGLNKEVADLMIKNGFDSEKLGKILHQFLKEDRKEIALMVVKAGGDIYLFEIPKQDLTYDFAKELVQNGFDPKKFSTKLGDFQEKDRKDIALMVLKAGGFINLATIPDCDLDFAKKLVQNGFDPKELGKNLGNFQEKDRKEIALMVLKAGGDFDLTDIPEWDLDFAKKLVQNGFDPKKLGKNLGNFQEKDRKEVALMIVKAGGDFALGYIPETDRNLDFAKKLVQNGFDPKELRDLLGLFLAKDRKEIALMIVKAGGDVDLGYIPEIDRNLDFAKQLLQNGFDTMKLGGLLGLFLEKDRKEIALMIVKAGGDFDLGDIPEEDRNLDFAKQLLQNGFDTMKLGQILSQFQGKDRKEIALMVVKAGGNIKLQDIPKEDRNLDFAKKLVENGFDPKNLGQILGKFQDNDRKEIALMVLKAGGDFDFSSIPLEDRDMDFVNKMIESGYDSKKLGEILHVFKGDDRKDIALMVLKAGGDFDLEDIPEEDRNLNFANLMVENGFDPRKLGKILGQFKETDRTDIALIAIKAGADYIDLSNIPLKYCNLDFSKKMIENGFDPKKLGRNLGQFQEKDRKDIALIVIKTGGIIDLTDIPEEDRNLDFAKLMVENGFNPKILGQILGLFKGTDRKEIALMVIKVGGDIDLISIPLEDRNLNFANKMIENGFDPKKLGRKLSNFQEKDRKEIALMTLKAGGNINFNQIPPEDLDDELANAMIDAGFKDDVKKNKKRFILKLRTKMRLW